MQFKKGKFIVLYGINNLGKTTQAKLLVKRIKKLGKQVEYIKYPIYKLEPSGILLNNYLREGNTYKLTPKEAQIIYTMNRVQYQEDLLSRINKGINIIAEDYIGTGLCWGIGTGVDKKFLQFINKDLKQVDRAFLFLGKRFTESTEKGHRHETNTKLLNKVEKVHKSIGKEQNWIKINANLKINEINDILWQNIQKII